MTEQSLEDQILALREMLNQVLTQTGPVTVRMSEIGKRKNDVVINVDPDVDADTVTFSVTEVFSESES